MEIQATWGSYQACHDPKPNLFHSDALKDNHGNKAMFTAIGYLIAEHAAGSVATRSLLGPNTGLGNAQI
eukprot:344009-Chlamydomonas_euryale.AAC.3